MLDEFDFLGYVTKKTLRDWKDKEVKGTCHSLYEHTINFFIGETKPNLLVIGWENVKGTPNSIYCPEFNQLSRKISPQSSCFLSGKKLIIDKTIVVSLIEIQEEMISPLSFDTLSHSSLFLEKYQIIKELKTTSNPYLNNQAIKPFYDALINEAKSFLKVLRTNDIARIKQSMFRIIGLGVGLTPSGDDYLTGLMLFLRLAKETDSKLKWQLELVLKEEDLPTNIISEQQLFFASFGRSKQLLIRLINNIGDDEQSINQFKNDVRLVQQIGSTSGFDLLLGISDGIKLLKEMR